MFRVFVNAPGRCPPPLRPSSSPRAEGHGRSFAPVSTQSPQRGELSCGGPRRWLSGASGCCCNRHRPRPAPQAHSGRRRQGLQSSSAFLYSCTNPMHHASPRLALQEPIAMLGCGLRISTALPAGDSFLCLPCVPPLRMSIPARDVWTVDYSPSSTVTVQDVNVELFPRWQSRAVDDDLYSASDLPCNNNRSFPDFE